MQRIDERHNGSAALAGDAERRLDNAHAAAAAAQRKAADYEGSALDDAYDDAFRLAAA